MGYLTGLKAVNEKLASRGGGNFEDRVKATWANLKGDGDSAKVYPLQEIDDGSPNYSEKNGLALFVLEHSNPDDFTKNAECTADEGGCYACEQGWYQKTMLYVNVLFDDGKEKPYVAVLSKGTGKGSVGKALIEIASDSDFDNSITGKVFKFTRSGVKKDTSYSFTFIKNADIKVEDYTDQLFDLKEVPFKVKYEKQEAYYTGNASRGDSQPAAATAKRTSTTEEW